MMNYKFSNHRIKFFLSQAILLLLSIVASHSCTIVFLFSNVQHALLFVTNHLAKFHSANFSFSGLKAGASRNHHDNFYFKNYSPFTSFACLKIFFIHSHYFSNPRFKIMAQFILSCCNFLRQET
jgi:hypothetical protein